MSFNNVNVKGEMVAGELIALYKLIIIISGSIAHDDVC